MARPHGTRLTRWRVQLVYSPHVIREIMRGTRHLRWEARWNGTAAARDRAADLVIARIQSEICPLHGIAPQPADGR